MEFDNKNLDIDCIYDNKIARDYFSNLKKIKSGKQIIENYKETIQKCALNGFPFSLVFDREEFSNNNYAAIRMQMTEKLVALTALAQKMGYRVKNKGDSFFCTDDCAGIIMYISKDSKKV